MPNLLQPARAVLLSIPLAIYMLAGWNTNSRAEGSEQANAQSAEQPVGAIALQQIKANLYRFSRLDSNGSPTSGVLLVGSKAAVVGDPLDIQTAKELDKLIKAQFEVPVRYVFYTHANPQRGAGVSVFTTQGATLVAHANAIQSRAIQDGSLSAPDLLFNDSLILNLGDNWNSSAQDTIVLRYLGKSASDDMIIAHFPQHEAVFASDFVVVDSLSPSALEQGFFPEWFATIDQLNKIDYSYFLPGQGEIGIRSDAIAHGHYLRELHRRVTRLLEKGLSEEQIITEIDLSRFQRWQHYDTLQADNVRGMIKSIAAKRLANPE